MRANVYRSHFLVLVVALVVSSDVVCLADEVRPLPKGATIGRSDQLLRYLAQEPVREDLKLTAEQRERIDRWRQEERNVVPRLTPRPPPQEFLNRMAEESEKLQAALEEILTPDQIRRHFQLMLQHAVVSQRGLTGLLQLKEVQEILKLDLDQQQQIETIEDNAAAASMERFRLNQPQPLGMFANGDLTQRNLDDHGAANETDRQVSEALTASQKQSLLEFLGPPLVGQVMPVFFTPPQPPLPPPEIGRVRMPRLALFRAPVPSLGPSSLGGEILSESSLQAALLTLESVRDELQISPELVQKDVLLGGDAAELTRCIRQLDRWLEPAQLARLRQIVLQTEFERRGPAAALAFREVVEALQLSDEQRVPLDSLVKNELNSNRHSLVMALEGDPAKRGEIEKGVTDRLNGLLTATQRERLTELRGKLSRVPVSLAAINRALRPRISARARTVTALGELKLDNAVLLQMAAIQDELELSDEQREAVSNTSELIRNREKVMEILSEKQRKRFMEILLQGEVRRDGPAALFRYRPVIEALALNEDEQRWLLEVVQEDTRSYLRIPLEEFSEKLPDLDAATAAKLESVLTDEQREKLAGLLGEPAHSIDEPARPAGRNRP